MKQKNTLQWISIAAGKARLLVGVLVAVQAVLSVSSIAFAFVLRRIINMAVDGAWGSFWAALAALVGILLGQIILSAAGRRSDGRSQSRPDEAKQFFQPVQHRLRRCHGWGVSAGHRGSAAMAS